METEVLCLPEITCLKYAAVSVTDMILLYIHVSVGFREFFLVLFVL